MFAAQKNCSMPIQINRHPIVLLGYMGCGKSLVGKQLANTLQVPFVDLDVQIEASTGLAISEIFEKKSEVFFRKIEHEALLNLLESDERKVISLGGGTPCFYNHMDEIARATPHSFYLKTGIPTLVERLRNETTQRPILQFLKTEEALAEYIAKHLFERNPYYTQARHTLLTDGRTPAELIEEIIEKLK